MTTLQLSAQQSINYKEQLCYCVFQPEFLNVGSKFCILDLPEDSPDLFAFCNK